MLLPFASFHDAVQPQVMGYTHKVLETEFTIVVLSTLTGNPQENYTFES